MLELPGLTMRPWEHSDVEDILKAFGDPSIRGWTPSSVDTAADARAFVDRRAGSWSDGTGTSWAVTNAERGTVLGHVAVWVTERGLDCAMIGYWLLPRARGRGAATEAVRAAAAFAFGHLDLHRIELAHDIANEPSCRVAERAGFPYEGTLRDAMRLGDKWSTEHLHARLVTDP